MGQDFILVHNPYKKRKTVKNPHKGMTALESYRKFKKHNCFCVREYPLRSGKMVNAFELTAKNRDDLIMDYGYDSSYAEPHILKVIIASLGRLGFKAARDLPRTGGYGRRDIMWVLRDQDKFRKSLPEINIGEAFSSFSPFLPSPSPSPSPLPSLFFCSQPQPQPQSLLPIDTSTLPDFDEVGSEAWKKDILSKWLMK